MRMQRFWDSQGTSGVWSGYYDGPTNVQTYNFFARRQSVVRLLEKDGKYPRILDVGCGSGDYMEVADAHDGSFFGIDYAHGMIEKAIKRFPGHGKEHLFVTGSGDKLPFKEDMFDLVIGLGYIEYFPRPADALDEIVRVMKPGGICVMQAFKKDILGQVDDYVLDPINKYMVRPVRKMLGQKLGPMKPPLPDDWFDQKYQRGELDRLMGQFGFSVRNWEYNNFHVFPKFLMKRAPRAYMNWSDRIQKSCPRLFGATAVNYIAAYRLDKKG